MGWTRTRVSEALGIRYPIVQGPFGGGYSTPALAAAVSNAGGLGSFGAAHLEPDAIHATIREIAARTSHPFNINLWVPIAGQDDAAIATDPAAFAQSVRQLRPYLEQVGLPAPELPARFAPRYEDQVVAVLDARPPVWSFVMGIPDPSLLRDAKARGITTIGTVTTVEEAEAMARAGVDLVVASGSDAGGHRSTFLRSVESSLVGTFSLVPQVASAIGLPVIAAGGLADGRGVAAALALGAEGVQIGTAFLAAPESNAPAAHRQLLGRPAARTTRLTRVFTGRHARGIENALMLALDDRDVLPFPAQNWLTTPLRRAAAAAGRADLLALWAGQNAASARALPAATLLAMIVDETDRVLASPRLAPRSL